MFMAYAYEKATGPQVLNAYAYEKVTNYNIFFNVHCYIGYEKVTYNPQILIA